MFARAVLSGFLGKARGRDVLVVLSLRVHQGGSITCSPGRFLVGSWVRQEEELSL